MCICKICGKHYMKHHVGNIVNYIHYDYTSLCIGGYNELSV